MGELNGLDYLWFLQTVWVCGRERRTNASVNILEVPVWRIISYTAGKATDALRNIVVFYLHLCAIEHYWPYLHTGILLSPWKFVSWHKLQALLHRSSSVRWEIWHFQGKFLWSYIRNKTLYLDRTLPTLLGPLLPIQCCCSYFGLQKKSSNGYPRW